MKIEYWLQMILGTAILGTLGFFGVNLFDIKGTLGSVETKVDTNAVRVNRIAEILPEMKVRVAWEEINFPIKGFITTSMPQKLDNNEWLTRVAVYDHANNEMKVFSMQLDENHKNLVGYAVAGKLRSEYPYDASFEELAEHSASLKEAVTIPEHIDATTSFIIRTGSASEYEAFLANYAKEEPESVEFAEVGSWKELSGKLVELEELKEPN